MYQVATKRRAAALQQRSQRLVPLSGRITHGFKRSQTGYVSANEGILPLCLLDSSHCLLSSVISCRVMWRQRSNRGQSDPPRSSLPHLLALTPARPGPALLSPFHLTLLHRAPRSLREKKQKQKIKTKQPAGPNEFARPPLLISDWLWNHLFSCNLIVVIDECRVTARDLMFRTSSRHPVAPTSFAFNFVFSLLPATSSPFTFLNGCSASLSLHIGRKNLIANLRDRRQSNICSAFRPPPHLLTSKWPAA